MANLILKRNNKTTNITKTVLLTISIIFIFVMLIVPIFVVISYCFKNGFEAYKKAVLDEYTIKALQLTLLATIVSVFINTIFGVFAAWTITKFNFKGKNLLTTLIDIPFAISPVIGGLIFVLAFGRIGWAYEFMLSLDI